MRKIFDRVVDAFWLGCIAIVPISMHACASLPRDIPTAAKVADQFDDALAVVATLREYAAQALPAVCAGSPDGAPSDECVALTDAVAGVDAALPVAREKVSAFRDSGESFSAAAKAVEVALREARKLAK